MPNPLTYLFDGQETGWFCGPASVQIALRCRGINRTETELARQLGTDTFGTDSSADVVRVLNQILGAGTYDDTYIPGATATAAEAAALKAVLVRSIDAGYAIVANVVGTVTAVDGQQYTYDGGHYVAVTGYRAGGDAAFVADVGAPAQYWVTTKALAVWIAERGYSYKVGTMARWTDIAEWVGPTVNQGGPMVEYRGLVLHIMQGSYAGSISWGKNPASDVSFHFATRGDGHIGQLVDTNVTAWTQGSGNGHWISVENEGFSGNPLTPAQVEACAKIYARGVRDYGWPLQSTDSTSGRGLGWHGMGGAAWGGHPDCPGQPIKDQRPAILARAAQIAGGDMAGLTPEQLSDLYIKVVDLHYLWFTADSVPARPEKSVARKIDDIHRAVKSGGGSVSGPVDLTEAALDAVEARAFKAAQRAEDA